MALIKRNGWVFDDQFAKFERQLARGCSRAVDKTARTVVGLASREAPKDTTALSKSGAVRSALRDELDAAEAAVKQANPGAAIDETVFGTRENWEAEDIAVAEVVFIVAYAGLIHNGYESSKSGRRLAGRPFLRNALRAAQSKFEEQTRRELAKAGIHIAK